MTTALSEDLVGRLSGFVTQRFGLRFPPDRWNELSRGLASAALELGVSDLQGWAEHLAIGGGTEEHLRAVANHLTVAETYFYRHRETFTLIEQKILPARLARRKSQFQPLRIWSAGCASGEEPYSIAMTVLETFGSPGNVSIFASDLDTNVLATAERGVYAQDRVDKLEPERLRRFFLKGTGAQEGLVSVRPELKSMITFQRINLLDAAWPVRGPLDVIFCRNVMIYFDKPTQYKILSKFAPLMQDDGLMFAGHSESFLHAADLFKSLGKTVYALARSSR